MNTIRLVLPLLALLAASAGHAEPASDSAFFGSLAAAEKQAVEQAKAAAPKPQPLSRDLKYVRTSIEWAALCRSQYMLGLAAVKKKARGTPGSLAVVLDLDETVLDNSQYQAERDAAHLGFTPDSFNAWVQREEAATVPGADEFLKGVYALGPRVHVVFITDRTDAQKQATLGNLAKQGLLRGGNALGPGDLLLTKSNAYDNKLARRICVERGWDKGTVSDDRCMALPPTKIIALFGDSLRDFVEYYQSELIDFFGSDYSMENAKEAIARDPRWDTEWFLLPNPVYGQWFSDYK